MKPVYPVFYFVKMAVAEEGAGYIFTNNNALKDVQFNVLCAIINKCSRLYWSM